MISSRQVNISRVVSIAALGIALLIVALLLWRAWQSAQFSAGIFGYPFQVDESEGMIAAETLLLDQGQNIYNFPGPQQFVAAPYPPLYYLLNLPLIHFTGYSLKVGRALTILSTLAAAVLIFALVKLTTRRRLAALAAALAFLANSLTAFWGAIVKPDLPAMAFALLGLYLVGRSVGIKDERVKIADIGQQGGPPPAPTEEGNSYVGQQGKQRFAPTDRGDEGQQGGPPPAPTDRGDEGQQGGPPPAPTDRGDEGQQGEQRFAPTERGSVSNSKLRADAIRPYGNSKLVYAAAVAFALAMLTKQTSVAAAGAGFIVLLWADWRRGLKAIGLYVVIVGGVSLLLDWQTAGGYYWHIVTVHALPWNFGRLVTYVQTVWSVNWPLILMGGVGLTVAVVSAMRGASQRLNRVSQRIRFNGEAEKADVAKSLSQRERFGEGESSLAFNSALSTQHSALSIMLLLYAVAAVVQASGVGTLGGVHNHFLDALSALCIGFGLLLGWLLDRAADARTALPARVAGLAGLGGAAILVWLLISAEYDLHDLNAYQFRLPTASQLEGMSNIAQFATNNGGPLYSDNISIVLSAHQRPRSTDPYTQTHASSPAIHPNPADRWDESQLVADIRAGKFALIILAPSDPCQGGGGEVSPAIAAAVCDSYKLIQRNVEFVYQPKLR